MCVWRPTDLQEVDGQLGLEPVSHLNEGMIRLVAQELDSYDVAVDGEEVEEPVLVRFLRIVRGWRRMGRKIIRA